MAQSGAYYTRRSKHANLIPIDTSYMECIYHYQVHDPVLDKHQESFKILAIGSRLSMYSSYGTFQIDSLMPIDYPDGVTGYEYQKLSAIYHPTSEATIKDFAASNTTTYDRVPFSDNYVYEEPISLMDWTLQPGNEEVCGHKCLKATTSFRGRDWTVWYTPDIPVDNGPWKFGGLPGLILKAESADNEQKLEAVTIRPTRHTIALHKRNYQKTTREKLNEEYRTYCTDAGTFFSGGFPFKDINGNDVFDPNRRIFYSPLELE